MADIVTIPNFTYSGIKKIEIPKVDRDFSGADYGFNIIKKYLPQILSEHKENATKIDFLWNYFLGRQDILNKERLYQKDSKNNNIVVENHAYKQVSFKTAFITGEKRDYTHKADSNSDDLIFLDRYFTDVDFYGKDNMLKEWVFATGIGVTYTVPRTDIIIKTDKGTRYATAEDGYDINYEAPFKYSVVDPTNNFVVYSSGFDKEPLFAVSIIEVDVSSNEDSTPQKRKKLYIESRYASFEVESSLEFDNIYWAEETAKVTPKVLRYLPLIEHSSNSQRISLVEKNRSLFNVINTLASNTMDMIVDNANAIFVFKNTDVTQDTILKMREAGAIIIKDNVNMKQNSTASLDVIRVEIPFDGLNEFRDRIIEDCYDIAGVPLGSSQVTSGGDTGQARLLNGGWTNAYEMAQNDVRAFTACDYEVLKVILMICKQIPNCPLNQLYASQIDIKYRINQTDNFLVKTQGIMNLYNSNMPLDEILKACGMWGDITSVFQKWKSREQEVLDRTNVKTEVDTSLMESTTENGNDSQE